MTELPTENHISFKKGGWLIFELDQHKIVVWFSIVSGAEKIYVDGLMVSQRTTHRLESIHQVQIDGIQCSVTFDVINILKGESECIFKIGDEIQKVYSILRNNKKIRILPIVLCLALTVAFAFLAVFLGLPQKIEFLFVIVIAVLYFWLQNRRSGPFFSISEKPKVNTNGNP